MNRLKQVFKFLIFLGIGLFILYLIYNNQQAAYLADCIEKGNAAEDCSLLDKIILDFKSAQWIYVFIAILLYLLSCFLRAIRWNLLTQPLGHPIKTYNAFGAVMVGYLANLAIPRIGEFARAGVISRYENISTEKAFGTIITERAVDVIMLLIFILFSLGLESNKIITYFTDNATIVEKVKSLFTPTTIVLILGFTALIFYLFVRFKEKILNNSIAQKISNLVEGLKSGMLSIMALKRPYLFIFYSVSIWVLYYLMICITFKSFAPTADLSLQSALLVFVFGTLGIAFPSPGGMGSYHFLLMQGLALYGVEQTDGFSFANIMFFGVNIGGNVVFGLLSLLLLPILNKNAHDQG